MTVTRRDGALAGIAAAAVAIGVAELVAVATGPQSAPLVAVGGVVVDSVPESIKSFAISVFGTYDKLALLIGTCVLLAGFAAVVGVLAVRHVYWGYAGIALFAAVGVAAAVSRPGADALAAWPSLAGGLAAAGLLWFLLARKRPEPEPEPEEPPVGASSRRYFLRTVGFALGGAVLAGVGGRILSSKRDVTAAREAITLPTPVSAATPVPPGADLKLPDLTPYVTPNKRFYRIDTALVVPQVDPDAWTIRIHGRVRNPIELTYAQLTARPMVERYVTLACVSNEVGGGLISNARWLGVPVKDLLDEAGVLDGADQVVSRSADGWTCGTPTAILRDGRDALLAIGMNGEPLPIEHGFPVRMVTPGLYGYVSACKWIVEMELTTFADFDPYWVRRGWAAQGPIKTESRIDVPRAGTAIDPGRTTIAGIAWAQHTGVKMVEVQIDGGAWQPATLVDTVSVDTWRQWSLPWDATTGQHQIAVRATDNTGTTQTPVRVPPFPDGASGWDTIEVRVR